MNRLTGLKHLRMPSRIRCRTVLGCTLLLAVTALLHLPARGQNLSGVLVFSDGTGSGAGIALANPDSAARHLVAVSPKLVGDQIRRADQFYGNLEIEPTMASDGTIVFSTNRFQPNARYRLVGIIRDGSGRRFLTDDTQLGHLNPNQVNDELPAISPDGSRVAFISNRTWELSSGSPMTNDKNVWVVDADGTGLRQVTFRQFVGTSSCHGIGIVAWNPEGTRLAFIGNRAISNPPEMPDDGVLRCLRVVATMNPDGSDLRVLRTNRSTGQHNPQDYLLDWSETGILYWDSASRFAGYVIVDSESGEVLHHVPGAGFRGSGTSARFSPDGRHFAAVASDNRTLVIVDLEGTEVMRLPDLFSGIRTFGWADAPPVPRPDRLVLSTRYEMTWGGRSVDLEPRLLDAGGNVISRSAANWRSASSHATSPNVSVFGTVFGADRNWPNFEVCAINAGLEACATLNNLHFPIVRVDTIDGRASRRGAGHGTFRITRYGNPEEDLHIGYSFNGVSFAHYFTDSVLESVYFPGGDTLVHRDVRIYFPSDVAGSPATTLRMALQSGNPSAGLNWETPSGGRDASVVMGHGPQGPPGTALLGVSTPRASNRGHAAISFRGHGFDRFSSVHLFGDGNQITPRVMVRSDDEKRVDAVFDLRGRQAGVYDAVAVYRFVTDTLHRALVIEDSHPEVDVWTDVVGPARPGRFDWNDYTIIVGNRGTADVHDVLLLLRMTPGVDYEPRGILSVDAIKPGLAPAALNAAPSVQGGSEILLPIWIYRLPAGRNEPLTLRIRGGLASTTADSLSLSAEVIPPPSNEPFTWSGSLVDRPFHLRLLLGGVNYAVRNGHSSIDLATQGPCSVVPRRANPETLAAVLFSEYADWSRMDRMLALYHDRLPALPDFVAFHAAPLAAGAFVVGGLGDVQSPSHVRSGILTAAEAAGIGFALPVASELSESSLNHEGTGAGGCLPARFAALPPFREFAGPPGVGDGRYVAAGAAINYRIDLGAGGISGTGRRAHIVAHLDDDLFDLDSFSLGPIRIGAHQIVPPPGSRHYHQILDLRPQRQMRVAVLAVLDRERRQAVWQAAAINVNNENALTDTLDGFIHSYSGEPALSVAYSVGPHGGAASGTPAASSASVSTLSGDRVTGPFKTDAWVNTIDATPPESRVVGISGDDGVPEFVVSWEGSDEGAGVLDYTVYVSQNDGAFEPWITTRGTSAVYQGEPGATYGFFSIARDMTGLREPMKSTAESSTATSGEQDGPAELPTVFALHPNYPNPFNPSTTIPFEVPRPANVELKIYDVIGREIVRLVDEETAAGRYTVLWDAADLPSGLYFVRMQAGDFAGVQKVVLVK